MNREKRLRQIIEGLFEIATPGNVKNSLWQAYQSVSEQTEPAADLEQEITTMLHQLPVALTITKRTDNRYVWEWLSAKGEGNTFIEALENALTHIEVSYTVANEL